MRKTLLLTAVIMCGHCLTSIAQSNCAQTLRLAQSVYDQGRLHELESLLKDCLRSGFSDNERSNALKLLTLTYIYLEEPVKADATMLELLQTNHEFRVNENVDPAELVALYTTFRTHPIYRIGLNIGTNATQPNVSSTLETVAGSESEYKYRIGFQFSALVEIPFNKKLTINSGMGYQLKSFELSSRYNRSDNSTNKSLLNELTAIEKQSWISIPVGVQYQLLEKKYNPFIGVGVNTDLLLSDNIDGERLREDQTSVEPRNFEMKAQRNSVNVSAYLAAGAKMKVGTGFVVTELKFSYGITKVNNETSAYDNQDLYLSYGFPHSIFKQNSLSVTIGYAYNVYKPKKLTNRK
jgi:hypothetical protein